MLDLINFAADLALAGFVVYLTYEVLDCLFPLKAVRVRK
jgi:hypothetical protein